MQDRNCLGGGAKTLSLPSSLLGAQRTLGHHAQNPTRLYTAPNLSLCCSSFPGSLQKPLSQQLWKKSEVPSCFLTSNHPPQEEGVRTWEKQVTYVAK